MVLYFDMNINNQVGPVASNIGPVTCKNCGAVDKYYTTVSGPHVKATCSICDRYIKFLPQETNDDSTIDFGVHKGIKLAELPLNYKKWLWEQPWVKGGLRRYLNDRIASINQQLHEAR